MDPDIISQLSQNLEIELPERKSYAELKNTLAEHINFLINTDFNKLLKILYRVDVHEKILKTNLQKQETDAGIIIAEMIIERQLQKIKTRKKFKSNDDIPGDEKW